MHALIASTGTCRSTARIGLTQRTSVNIRVGMDQSDSGRGDRQYSLCVFGITGFTGKLVLKYINSLVVGNKLDPKISKLCFAGRSVPSMKEMMKSLCPAIADPALIAADVADELSIYVW
jgi:hypothetical protein